MNNIISKAIAAAALCFGMVHASADNVRIRLVTSQSPGAQITFNLPSSTRVSVDWGNGETLSYRDSVVTGTLAGDTITVTGSTKFTGFDCHSQHVKWIDLSGAPDLLSLDCSDNELETLSLTSSTALQELDCSGNRLKSLSAVKAQALRSLDCSGNELTAINIVPNNSLEHINISDNKISSLNVRTKNKLRSLWAANNKLTFLSFSNYAPMQSLVCQQNGVETVQLSNKAQMQDVWIAGNKITSFDLSESSELKTLDVSGNGLDTLALSKAVTSENPMQYINCSDNHLSFRCFYNPDITKKYVCGNQFVDFAPNTVAAGVYLDFSRFMINGSGRKNGILTLYNGTDGTQLKPGSSAKTGDYTMVAAAGRVKYWKNFPAAYLTVTSKDYPDLSIRTSNYAVYDEDIANGIESATADKAGINVQCEGRTVILTASPEQQASVVTSDGVTVWKGTVGSTPVEISVAPGVYIAGQKKIVVN